MLTKLVTKKDSAYGYLGLVVNRTISEDYNVATEGLLIAHDLVEHQNGVRHIGSITDELQACGGIWHTRGRWGDIRRNPNNNKNPELSVANELTRMACEVVQGCYVEPKIPRTIAHIHDESFKNIISVAQQEAVKEFTYINQWDHKIFELDHYWSVCLSYMRIGYRKCENRFGDLNSNKQFWSIAEAVDTCIKDTILYEGQEFVLNWGCGQATCTEKY